MNQAKCCFQISQCLGTAAIKVFGMKNDSTNENIVDCIRAQWNLFQLEDMPDESFMKKNVPHRVSTKYRTRLAGLVLNE